MRIIASFVAVCALVGVTGGVAVAEDPPFVGWTSALPPSPVTAQPEPRELCPQGEDSCVHGVIDEMTARFDELAAACHHDAPFALAYLRTTEEYHRFWHEDRFADPAFLNHYDVVFADRYFAPLDAWAAGDVADVPPAWRVALQASEDRAVTGYGSFALGMNAHINRDLAFVLERIGLVAPDGTSRKADHDLVNEFLNRVADTLIPEAARRFDPTIDDRNVEGTTADEFAGFQLIVSWRETAWRNAERLVAAPTLEARAQVAAEIEAYAEAMALEMRATYAYDDPAEADARDAWCAEHWDDV